MGSQLTNGVREQHSNQLRRIRALWHLHEDRNRTFFVSVRPPATLEDDGAGLPHIRSRSPPPILARFCSLSHIAIVSTSENWPKTGRNQYKPAHSGEMSATSGKPVPPMLATLGHPPTGERWAFESKWDGQRAITTTGSESPVLWSRNGNNISASFPEIVDALRSVLDHRETVLDGEIVALGPDGVPSFSLLQRRMHVLRPTAELRNEAVTSYYVFDVLDIDGASTTDLPYLERREALANLSLEHPRIKVPPHWLNVDGPTMLEVARKHHLEGIVAKNIASIYQPGKRSRDWIKSPLRANCEAVVCGFLPGSGGAARGVGSLILGAHEDSGGLRYIGNVGTGLTDRQRSELRDKLTAHRLAKSAPKIAAAGSARNPCTLQLKTSKPLATKKLRRQTPQLPTPPNSPPELDKRESRRPRTYLTRNHTPPRTTDTRTPVETKMPKAAANEVVSSIQSVGTADSRITTMVATV